jgi:cupin superfamily acireductone dioxygenase involved in methionine salvage
MDQMSSNTRIKELETEVDQVKSEKAAMSVKLEELNAEILKNNLENGKVLLSLSMDNTDSLAAEIGRSEASTATATTTSINNQDDNLLEKYALEVDKNQRLQDYIEDLVSTIMDHNPEILEINVSNKLKRTASVTKHK